MNDKKCEAVKTSCGATILRLDGTCAATCPDYDALDETAGLANKKCKAGATCSGDVTPILKRDGVCSATCPIYEFKNDTTKKCETVSCASEKTNVALKRDGVCAAKCPEYDELVNGKCVEKKVADCTSGQFLHIDGKCMAACPEFYEDLSSDKKCTLFTKVCTSETTNKLLTKDKTCVAKCDDYLFTDDTLKQCQTVTCTG